MSILARIWDEVMARPRWIAAYGDSQDPWGAPPCPAPLHRRWTIIKRQSLHDERKQADHDRAQLANAFEKLANLRRAEAELFRQILSSEKHDPHAGAKHIAGVTSAMPADLGQEDSSS